MGRHGGMQHSPKRSETAGLDDVDHEFELARDLNETPKQRRARERGETHGAGHGHGHSHSGPAAPVPARVRMLLALVLGPMLLAALVGLFMLWPSSEDLPEHLPFVSDGASVETAVATGTPDPSTVLVDAELDDGTAIQVVVLPEVVDRIHPGDSLRILYVAEAEGYGSPYVFVDFERDIPLWVLVAAFVVAVVLVARWRGLASIVGLGAAFVMIVYFTLPALLAGEPGLPVALVTAAIVMFVVLYVAHGFTARTTTALLGTLVGLGLTALIAWIATDATNIQGMGVAEAQTLYVRAGIDLRQVFFAGVVLAGMGVLNDVTITQASAVWEMREVAPHASRRELFNRAMRIGRDHIASTVYTIAFAYVGASLPVLMIMVMTDAPPEVRLTTGQVAEEIVRTLVGSIGLVLAIPLTTLIAAMVVPSKTGVEGVEEVSRKHLAREN